MRFCRSVINMFRMIYFKRFFILACWANFIRFFLLSFLGFVATTWIRFVVWNLYVVSMHFFIIQLESGFLSWKLWNFDEVFMHFLLFKQTLFIICKPFFILHYSLRLYGECILGRLLLVWLNAEYTWGN